MQRRSVVLGGLSGGLLAACGGGGSGSGGVGTAPAQQNRFALSHLVASSPAFKAQFTVPDFTDAWGIAIRPAGAGGHFWIGGGGSSWEFLGDVSTSPDPKLRTLTTDALTRVSVPGTQDPVLGGTVTGVAFNGGDINAANFLPLGQTMPDDQGVPVPMTGSSRFIFVTDSGHIGAWGERRQDNGAVMRHNGAAADVYDGSALGSAFFGVAVKPGSFDTLWVADFGADPQIRQLDGQWALVPTQGFANPFGSGPGGAVRPGDFVPFNIQAIGSRVFVTYAKSRPNPGDITRFFAGEEDAMDADAERASGYLPDRGRLVEFDTAGNRVRIYSDRQHLNAPWGVAIAPASFGAFAGAVLVGNFGGGGFITAFDGATGDFLGYLRGTDGGFVALPGLWGLTFGNGASLGDSDALYAASGPDDEASGLFSVLRYAPR